MRLDYYIFGYRKIAVSGEDRVSLVSALLRRNLTAKISPDGNFLVPSYRTKKYKSALKGINFTASEIMGLPSFILKYRYRYGMIFGIMIAFVYILFASSYVWDIRIEGNENVSEASVRAELSECGFSVGSPFRKNALSEIETDVLAKSKKIGWININKRGCVAYVSIKEKNTHESEDKPKGYSNVVASRDCIIQEITVRCGVACVKVGDTVKAGQLLISGVIPAELGGGFVRAEGEVLGAVTENLEVLVPACEEKTVYTDGEKREISIKIFNFSLKLFKKYGNIGNGCAIIEDVKEFVLFGRYRIPFGIKRVYVSRTAVKTEKHTESEMILIARARLNAKRTTAFSGADVLSLRTSGEFTDAGYKMTTRATLLKDIGEERYFIEAE